MTVWASKFNSPVASIALTNTPICHSNPSQKRWNWVNWIGKTLKTIDMDIFSILTVFFSRIALHNMRHYLPVITESITNYHQPWNLVLKKRQFRRCSASSPWLEGGSPRLSAKVSANGPISRGGNDRSCKRIKGVGKAEDVGHLRRKEAGHAEAHGPETCDWFFEKKWLYPLMM